MPDEAILARVRAIPEGFVRTYGDGEGLVALVGSGGFLEIALVNGSAAHTLSAGIGALVEVAAH